MKEGRINDVKFWLEKIMLVVDFIKLFDDNEGLLVKLKDIYHKIMFINLSCD